MISQGIKKDLRILYPEWITALLLASTPLALILIGAGIWDNPSELHRLQPFSIIALALGCIWLATAAFGKENTFGTFESMLSFPITRRQIWRKKCVAAATTIGSTIALFIGSVWLAKVTALSNFGFLKPNEYALALGYILLCAIGPAFLFTTYQCRFHEAFWITTLTPFGFIILVLMGTPESLNDYRGQIIAGILLAYGLVTLWLARSRMLHWEASSLANQNIVLKFPRFRSDSSKREKGTHSTISGTGRLVLKEIRIHQFSFIVTIVLAILYTITISTLRDEEARYGVIENLIINIRLVWLLIPIMIGAAAIAEERWLGVTPWHCTLPISRLRQWTIKLSVALGLGFILGSLVPWPIDHYFLAMMEENAIGSPIISERTHFLKLTSPKISALLWSN
jgi:ABC-type transport system involved in cytochrome c biogenesis permease component